MSVYLPNLIGIPSIPISGFKTGSGPLGGPEGGDECADILEKP